jgi:hypothetical protein
MQEVQWSFNAFPHLAYIPTMVRFAGPFFLRLAYDAHTIPIDSVNNKWKLSPTVAESWALLEGFLLFVADTLLHKSGWHLPIDFTNFPMPQSKGFLNAH